MLSWFPEAASSFAGDLDRLFLTITLIVGVWFIAAELLLLYLVVRYRRRKGQGAAYLPGTTLRSMSFVLVPCVVILGFDLVIDAASTPVWDKIKIDLPPHDELVRIQGEQWAWRFTYPGPDGKLDTEDDLEIVNELHVPLDKVVLFELTAKDVLHSLWIPELRL
jgi:cytochrome c oxidase subunit 2